MVKNICVCDICGRVTDVKKGERGPYLGIYNGDNCYSFTHMNLCKDCVANILTYIADVKASWEYNKEELK